MNALPRDTQTHLEIKQPSTQSHNASVAPTAVPQPHLDHRPSPMLSATFFGIAQSDVNRFLARCEKHFAIMNTEEEDKASIAASALRGDALRWWNALSTQPSTWEMFTWHLKFEYGSKMRQKRINEELLSIRQREDQLIYPFLAEKREIARLHCPMVDQQSLANDIFALITLRDKERIKSLKWTTLDELVNSVRLMTLDEESPATETLPVTFTPQRLPSPDFLRPFESNPERRYYEEALWRYYDERIGRYYQPAEPTRVLSARTHSGEQHSKAPQENFQREYPLTTTPPLYEGQGCITEPSVPLESTSMRTPVKGKKNKNVIDINKLAIDLYDVLKPIVFPMIPKKAQSNQERPPDIVSPSSHDLKRFETSSENQEPPNTSVEPAPAVEIHHKRRPFKEVKRSCGTKQDDKISQFSQMNMPKQD